GQEPGDGHGPGEKDVEQVGGIEDGQEERALVDVGIPGGPAAGRQLARREEAERVEGHAEVAEVVRAQRQEGREGGQERNEGGEEEVEAAPRPQEAAGAAFFWGRNRSRKRVSNLPARKSGSSRMRRCSGMFVLIPSTTMTSSERRMRAMASARSRP